MQKLGLNRVKEWYEVHERRLGILSLATGFVIDSLTLQRIDALRENLWIALNLIVVGTVIVLLNHAWKRGISTRAHFWLSNFLQFGFGALLGSFFIFYFRSATLVSAWPFLLLLVASMVANELFQKRYMRLALQAGYFYLSLFAFAIFLVPVLLGKIGVWIFLLSGVLSLAAFWGYTEILRKFAGARFAESKQVISRAVVGVFVAMNLLYFTNVIPPIPLSLTDGGVYHSVVHQGSRYIVESEEKGFLDYFKLREEVHRAPGEPLYVYSAVFSPARLSARVVHEWQYKSEGEWITATRIPLSVSGGRETGYRTYSSKANLSPGLWRVNVETSRGQLIGRISFRIVEDGSRPELVTVVKD